MVNSIKNQTLPAKKNQRDKDAGICERENSFLFYNSRLGVDARNVAYKVLYLKGR